MILFSFNLVYNIASKFVKSNSIVRACFIFLLCTLMTSANKPSRKKNFHRVENVIKQLVHTSAMRSSRYEARGKFGEHERCVRVARGVAESNSSFLSTLQTSRVLHISMNTRWRMNRLLIKTVHTYWYLLLKCHHHDPGLLSFQMRPLWFSKGNYID